MYDCFLSKSFSVWFHCSLVCILFFYDFVYSSIVNSIKKGHCAQVKVSKDIVLHSPLCLSKPVWLFSVEHKIRYFESVTIPLLFPLIFTVWTKNQSDSMVRGSQESKPKVFAYQHSSKYHFNIYLCIKNEILCDICVHLVKLFGQRSCIYSI